MQQTGEKKSPIGVDYEYGCLREVIVGGAFSLYPDAEKAVWIQEALKILPEDEGRKGLERSGKNAREIGKYDKVEQENRQLISILEGHDVKVWRPEELTVERVTANFGTEYVTANGFQQSYARDPLAVIGNIVIELSMGSAMRRADILGYRSLLRERAMDSNAVWIAMPAIDYHTMICGGYDKSRFPVLEGGDIIVLGKKILVGTSRNPMVGSSSLGIAWLRAVLAPYGYDVEEVSLKEQFLHLDVALSVPKPGLIIACLEAFCEGLPKFFDGWKVIPVNIEEAQRLAVNGLPIDDKHYILGTNGVHKWERIVQSLAEEGVKVYSVPFENHNEDGGSIRCATQPLFRHFEVF